VDSELERCEDQGTSAEVWSLRCSRADLTRLRGHTEEALEYLTAKEKAFPPENDDVPSLIGLKKTCGYCHGMLGKYAISDRLLEEAEHLARNAGFLELLCEVWYCQAWFLYVRANFEPSDRLFREILGASEQFGDGTSGPLGYGASGRTP